MKPRKVVLTLEVVTDLPLTDLRRAKCYSIVVGEKDGKSRAPMVGAKMRDHSVKLYHGAVLQAQANVVKS